jgi:CheY-like chemotaxis protein
MFKPFEQVCEPHRRSGGTGLGLSISQELVRLMGSEVEFESTPRVGSRFWFELSLPTIEIEPSADRPKKAITGYHGPRRNILIADDIAENRAVLARMLRSVGFEVREAANGLEAVEQVSSMHSDLIITDVMMPFMDGLEAMRAIRRLDLLKATPIMAVSASVGTDDQASSLAAGANVFLSKPLNQEHLFLEIGRLLELGWIYQEEIGGDTDGPIIAPSDAELLRLYEVVKAGNMRAIRSLADDLAVSNASLGAFAARLRELADTYDSKALVAFVESHIEGKQGVAA